MVAVWRVHGARTQNSLEQAIRRQTVSDFCVHVGSTESTAAAPFSKTRRLKSWIGKQYMLRKGSSLDVGFVRLKVLEDDQWMVIYTETHSDSDEATDRLWHWTNYNAEEASIEVFPSSEASGPCRSLVKQEMIRVKKQEEKRERVKESKKGCKAGRVRSEIYIYIYHC